VRRSWTLFSASSALASECLVVNGVGGFGHGVGCQLIADASTAAEHELHR
jgi:hypothetical protein